MTLADLLMPDQAEVARCCSWSEDDMARSRASGSLGRTSMKERTNCLAVEEEGQFPVEKGEHHRYDLVDLSDASSVVAGLSRMKGPEGTLMR